MFRTSLITALVASASLVQAVEYTVSQAPVEANQSVYATRGTAESSAWQGHKFTTWDYDSGLGVLAMARSHDVRHPLIRLLADSRTLTGTQAASVQLRLEGSGQFRIDLYGMKNDSETLLDADVEIDGDESWGGATDVPYVVDTAKEANSVVDLLGSVSWDGSSDADVTSLTAVSFDADLATAGIQDPDFGTGYDYIVFSVQAPTYTVGSDVTQMGTIAIGGGGGSDPVLTLTALAVSHEDVQLSWSIDPDTPPAGGYALVVSTDGSVTIPDDQDPTDPNYELPSGDSVIYQGGDSSYTHTGLSADTQYDYKIFALDQ